jgi:hypothetical protein
MDAQISWVRDLGSPTEAGIYHFSGIAVQVRQPDIDRARHELDKGLHDVIFNATLSEPISGDRKYVLGSIA